MNPSIYVEQTDYNPQEKISEQEPKPLYKRQLIVQAQPRKKHTDDKVFMGEKLSRAQNSQNQVDDAIQLYSTNMEPKKWNGSLKKKNQSSLTQRY